MKVKASIKKRGPNDQIVRRKGKLYLVFEYVDRNLLEVLEERPNGIDVNFLKLFNFLLKLIFYNLILFLKYY